jgi:hypothetical protein
MNWIYNQQEELIVNKAQHPRADADTTYNVYYIDQLHHKIKQLHPQYLGSSQMMLVVDRRYWWT